MDHNLFSVIPDKDKFIKLSRPFKATAFFYDYQIDLLNGVRIPVTFADFMQTFSVPYNNVIDDKRIIHFFYESGFHFEQLDTLIAKDDLLALDLQFTHSEEITLKAGKKLSLKAKHRPQLADYQNKFETGYSELKKGSFYQFNLTEEFTYTFNPDCVAMDFISAMWNSPKGIGEMSSATYVGPLNKLFLSNSPESLFVCENQKLISKPIKGTMLRTSDDPDEIKSLWQKLIDDQKSQAELFMITDLIRNDLNRIDLPVAVVEKKKAMLLVPKLIHQYSEISLKLKPEISFKQIIEKIFPGGSITGAPKKRVMNFLKSIENRRRGFYCGSTLMMKNGKLSASINIRSCEIDFVRMEISCQAGGGITLKSTASEEFNELTYKHDSFIDRLNP